MRADLGAGPELELLELQRSFIAIAQHSRRLLILVWIGEIDSEAIFMVSRWVRQLSDQYDRPIDILSVQTEQTRLSLSGTSESSGALAVELNDRLASVAVVLHKNGLLALSSRLVAYSVTLFNLVTFEMRVFARRPAAIAWLDREVKGPEPTLHGLEAQLDRFVGHLLPSRP